MAVWVLLSGADDLFLQAMNLYRRVAGRAAVRWPTAAELVRAPRSRIAVFVPLWREFDVIERMLRHNLKVTRNAGCEFFVGVYPNDPETRAAAGRIARRHSRVKVAMNPQPGPTSKADCLNAIFRRLVAEEERSGQRYDVVVLHDAEDLIHPQEPLLMCHFAREFDMVQVPVLPLPTPAGEWTHGTYCDEFAEFQLKDVPVRQMLGGFIASCGVGTGFSRAVLDRLAADSGGHIFEPGSLAEDYQIGLRIHQLGRRQVFLNLRMAGAPPVATREYFPRTFRAAVRQRTRWVMGIALQSWERYGWSIGPRQWYWLWRDRKGLIGNLLSPVVNAACAYGAAGWVYAGLTGSEWQPPAAAGWPEWAVWTALALSGVQSACRVWSAGRIYGWRFALWAPARAVWGNGVNCAATALALWRFFTAKLQGNPLVWAKTEHMYPTDAALAPYSTRAAAQEFRGRP